MCNIFSIHICFEKGKNWGKIFYISGVHHEKDREKIKTEKLLALETIKTADMTGGWKITHLCGQKISKKEEWALLQIAYEWGLSQNTQELLEKIAVNDPEDDVRRAATEKLENQELLEKIAVDDPEDDVRRAATKKLENQELLEKIAVYDSDWGVRCAATEKLENQELLEKIAANDANWAVRRVATEKLENQELLEKIEVDDPDDDVRHAATEKLHKKVI
jgi:hypothetical protein